MRRRQLFKIVFVAIAGFSALRLLFAPDGWRFADELPGKVLMSVYGLIIGALSALMGIGGGQIANLFMTFHGRSIHQAIATSSGLGALIAVPATLGYIYAGWPRAAEFPNVTALQFPYALGYVSLIGTLLVVPTSIAGRPVRRPPRAPADQAPARGGVRVVSAGGEPAVFGEFGGEVIAARMQRSANAGIA